MGTGSRSTGRVTVTATKPAGNARRQVTRVAVRAGIRHRVAVTTRARRRVVPRGSSVRTASRKRPRVTVTVKTVTSTGTQSNTAAFNRRVRRAGVGNSEHNVDLVRKSDRI